MLKKNTFLFFVFLNIVWDFSDLLDQLRNPFCFASAEPKDLVNTNGNVLWANTLRCMNKWCESRLFRGIWSVNEKFWVVNDIFSWGQQMLITPKIYSLDLTAWMMAYGSHFVLELTTEWPNTHTHTVVQLNFHFNSMYLYNICSNQAVPGSDHQQTTVARKTSPLTRRNLEPDQAQV